MKAYREISLDVKNLSMDNQKLKQGFAHFISDVKSFNGSIPGVTDLSFLVIEDILEINFVGYKFQVMYRYKRAEGKSLGVLQLYELAVGEDKKLKSETEFDFERKILGTDMAFNSETETMAIILNILVSAMQS